MEDSLGPAGEPPDYERGISSADATRRLHRIRRIVRLMDEAFLVPGTNVRVGWDGLVGLVPGVGDVATGLVAAYIVREAHLLGAPKWMLARMCLNVGVDVLLGTVPVAGDLLDVVWKANRKNLRLLEEYLEQQRHGPSGSTNM